MSTPESMKSKTAEEQFQEKSLPDEDIQYKSDMVAEQSSDPEKPERDLGFLSKSSDEELMRMMRAFFQEHDRIQQREP
eukprot:4461888-Karenia_brevis.AAC.1